MGKTNARFYVHATLIRAAMKLDRVHPREKIPVDWPLIARVEDTGYATHADLEATQQDRRQMLSGTFAKRSNHVRYSLLTRGRKRPRIFPPFGRQ